MKISAFVGAFAGFGLLAASLLTPVVHAETAAERRAMVHGLTQPSERRHLTFQQMGVIGEIKVIEGADVKAAQVIASQDKSIDLKELERLELQANSTARVEAAEASLKQKRAVLSRKEGATVGVFSAQEVEEARLDADTDEKRLVVAREDQMEAKIKMEQQKLKLAYMDLKSPVDGRIETISVGAGEITDPQHDAITVVTNDPLYIEVRDLSTRQVAKLKLGDKLQVRYDNDAEGQWHEAELWNIAPVAITASDTQLIKLKMPNPEKRDSGLGVMIKLPPEVAEAGQTRGATPTAKINP